MDGWQQPLSATAATNKRWLRCACTSCRRAMVYVNTRMIQDVLANDGWRDLFTPEDYRGLTPLTWAHVAMHGEFELNMNTRLTIGHPGAQPG